MRVQQGDKKNFSPFSAAGKLTCPSFDLEGRSNELEASIELGGLPRLVPVTPR